MNEQLLLDCYYLGWELSSDNEPFPLWFETYEEKTACLLGYNSFEMGVERSKEEILKEIKR